MSLRESILNATDLSIRIRESASLVDRLKECRERVARMAREQKPPRMSIPVNWSDDDVFIDEALENAITILDAIGARDCVAALVQKMEEEDASR